MYLPIGSTCPSTLQLRDHSLWFFRCIWFYGSSVLLKHQPCELFRALWQSWYFQTFWLLLEPVVLLAHNIVGIWQIGPWADLSLLPQLPGVGLPWRNNALALQINSDFHVFDFLNLLGETQIILLSCLSKLFLNEVSRCTFIIVRNFLLRPIKGFLL